MVRELEAELLADVGAVLGEGPAWDGRRQELVWRDLGKGRRLERRLPRPEQRIGFCGYWGRCLGF